MTDTVVYLGSQSGLPLRADNNGDGTYSLAVSSSDKGNKTFFAIAPDNTADLLLAANPNRKFARFYNNGAVTVFLGKDSSVSTTNGMPLPAAGVFEDRNSNDAWYGITALTASDIRGYEVA